MCNLTESQLKEISEQLDIGFDCFIHKQTSELIFLPNLMNIDSLDNEFYNDEMEVNFDDYYKIEFPDSNISFNIMLEFTESINDIENIKAKLFDALNQKKPFRKFKSIIDNTEIFRDKWFEFKNQKLIAYVKDQYYNEIEE